MIQVDPELLSLLRCPETQQRLEPAGPALIEKLNQQIGAGQLRNQAGEPVSDKLEGGLVREDGRRLYPLRHDIPVLLAEESIPLPSGSA